MRHLKRVYRKNKVGSIAEGLGGSKCLGKLLRDGLELRRQTAESPILGRHPATCSRRLEPFIPVLLCLFLSQFLICEETFPFVLWYLYII